MTVPLRIIFAGTPDFAATSLAALLKTTHEIVAVYTQPDRPAGRGRKLTASPVKQLALEHNLPVIQPLSLKTESAQAELAAFNADLMIVVAYGLILPKVVLDTPRLGCINVHASLLPRWRGAAPIHRALLAGDHETGITIMQMDVGLDTGNMLCKSTTPIYDTDTSHSLHDRLAALGAETLVQSLDALTEGPLAGEVQDDTLACYAEKLQKEEGRLDWAQSAVYLARQVRGLNPWPVAWCVMGEQILRVWDAQALEMNLGDAEPGTLVSMTKDQLVIATGEGALALKTIQLPGHKAQPVSALLNGKHPFLLQQRFN
ncbi:methionyl-tRNA formyltransferase [Nitrincola tibetensis]|uniref:Methionyl-tRNA formyltransferase n=1 Tax=Nitrincola tibetensis TaxID=2219697 RepID=A0A364NLV7_9GAMM|nr:methionyl-tRNA formyltransferase [Nitrincola tibetensis]RAU18014.1 methionyl-tRNA formyltransferase [Nitrincola tibetensis]